MTSEEKEKQDILNNINDQFQELIELIAKDKKSSFSMKAFDQLKKKPNKRINKWSILGFLTVLSIVLYLILSNEKLSYDIYFVFLSFFRIIIIKVNRNSIE